MARMRSHERAAFIREQLDRILNDPMNPLAHPASLDPPNDPSMPAPAPAEKKKKPRTRRLAAKTVLQASGAAAAPAFIHRPADIARHRRKCAVCRHPERETIEDLFIHWHSPTSIANYFDNDDEEEGGPNQITWVSIYRHAYAFGLDEIRRRNLRFAFEHILEQAGDISPTSASIIVAARALGSCVNESGQWSEPPKRVLVTNIIRNESPQTAPEVPRATGAGAPSFAAGLRQAAQSEEVAKGGMSPAPFSDPRNCNPDAGMGEERSSSHACPDSPVAASLPGDALPAADEHCVPPPISSRRNCNRHAYELLEFDVSCRKQMKEDTSNR